MMAESSIDAQNLTEIAFRFVYIGPDRIRHRPAVEADLPVAGG